eukprot:g9123.t1
MRTCDDAHLTSRILDFFSFPSLALRLPRPPPPPRPSSNTPLTPDTILKRRLISRVESNPLNKSRNIFDFSEPADPSDPSVQQLLSAKLLCRPDAPPLPSPPFRPVYDLNIKHLNAAIRTLLHDNVVDVYGWSPRLLSYLLNDPHCQPCLILFVNHIAICSLPASSFPAFRVRKAWGFGMVLPLVGRSGLFLGALLFLFWLILAVCLLIAKSDDEAVADGCHKSLDLSPTQFALGADRGNQAAYGPGATTYTVYFAKNGFSPVLCLSHDDGCNQGDTLSMLLAFNSVVKQTHDAIEHTRSAAVVYADNFTFPACSASDAVQAARALIASSEWDQSFSLDFILWSSRSDPPSDLVVFAAEHNKSIDIGFCKFLGGVLGNYNDEQWCSSMADAVVAKAFSRIDVVFDALSSPDVSHQISYHILSSTLPSYLMHTLRITPPAILLPILDRFHLRLFRSALNCFGVCPTDFDSLPSYLRRAVSSQLFLPCRLAGFKLPDLPMLAPIAYAASISQSLPRILPLLRMAAPDYFLSVTLPDLDLELEDKIVHPMFLEIAPTIDRLRFLQRAFPTSSHYNSSSLPIPLDKKCFASLLNRVRHFEWLDSSAPQRYCARIRSLVDPLYAVRGLPLSAFAPELISIRS